jgi:polysaccharide pyruvyl transferase WcaK-like protein
MTARSDPQRVVVTHMSRDGNKGDLAILTATVKQIREFVPEAVITVLSAELAADCSWKEEDTEWTRGLGVALLGTNTPALRAFPGGRLAWCLRLARAELAIWLVRLLGRRALRLLAPPDRALFSALLEADRVVTKGGSYLHTYDRSRDLVYLWRMVYPLRAAAAARRTVIPIGITIGPFSSRAAARWAGRALRRSPCVYVREAASPRVAATLDLDPARASVIPDVALGLERPRSPASSERRSGGPRLGLALRDLPQRGLGLGSAARGSYRRSVLEASQAFLARHPDGEIRLIPQATEDIAFELEIAEDLDSTRAGLVALDGSLEQLLAAYGGLDLLIASRLHAVLLSLLAGTAAFHIACEPQKSLGTMSLLGLDDAVVEIGQLSGPALAGEIERRLRVDDRNGTPSSADLDSYERTISSAFASVFLPA